MLSISTIGFMVYYSLGASMSNKNCRILRQRRHQPKYVTARWQGLHIIMACAATACLLFFFLGEPVIRLFTDDVAVIAVAMLVIPPLMLYQVGDALQVTYANALRGITDVRPMMITAIIAYLIVGLPLGYLLGIPLRHGASWASTCHFAVALLLAGVLFLCQISN